MMLSLSELRDRKGDRDLAFSLPLMSLEVLGNVYEVRESPLATLNVQSDGRSLSLHGRIEGVFSTECARCLSEAVFTVSAVLSEEWLISGEGSEELEDIAYSGLLLEDGDTLDLGEYVRQTLVEVMPLRVLCQADCRGLCPNCGVNLAERDCVCAEPDVDPRLAVLGRLLHNKGGVENGGSKKKNI
ncbi:MAG TPA: DUF177 domain-containing protein [Bacillota bacterium]|nr:DUF177 domain-containing protein [Bacillota bacterium]